MKYLKIISLVLVLSPIVSPLNAQDKPTIFLGGNINSFDSNTDKSEFLQSDLGLNIGYFMPLWVNDNFNVGLNVFGQYGAVNDDFDNLNNRFVVLPQENTTSETSSNKVNQSLYQLGIGPQLNFKVANALWISPIFQVGYFNFIQDELILTQSIESTRAGDPQNFKSEVTRQEEINEGGVFFKPAVKLNFELTDRWSLWGEASYFAAQLNTTQKRLIPLGEPNEQGAYFVDQIVGSQDFSTVENEQKLNGFGFSFGVSYSFGSSRTKAQDYNSSRSNKTISIAGDPDGAAKDSTRTAQDYNAARSNKPSSIASDPDGDNLRQANLMAQLIHPSNAIIAAGSAMLMPYVSNPLYEGGTNAAKANKNATAIEQRYSLEPVSNLQSVAPAQDYNSSRSNKPSSIAGSGDLDSDGFPDVLANASFSISKRSARNGRNQNLTNEENNDLKGLHFELEINWSDPDSDDDDGLLDAMESGITYSISKRSARAGRNAASTGKDDQPLNDVNEWTYDLKTMVDDSFARLTSGAKLVVLFAKENWHIDLQFDPDSYEEGFSELSQNNSFTISKRIAGTSNPDGKWEPNILCGTTDHFIHDGDCNDSDRQRTPEQSKAINNRLNQNTSVEKGQDNPLYDSDIRSTQNPLYAGAMNGGGNDAPDLCGNTNHLAHSGGDCDDTNDPITPGAAKKETEDSKKGDDYYMATPANAAVVGLDSDQDDSYYGSPYSISQVQEGVYVIYNSLISIDKKNSPSDQINSIIDKKTDADSLQTKHTNPYIVSNELAGEMELESQSNQGNINNPMFAENQNAGEMVFSEAPSNGVNQVEFKRLLEIEENVEINDYKYVFFKDGKAYRINLSAEKLEQLFDQIITQGIISKEAPCPPTTNPAAQCKLIDGFCFCRL